MPAVYDQSVYDLPDVDVDTAASAARYDTPVVDAPGTDFADTDLQQVLTQGFTQERQRLERRHALASQHLEELTDWFSDVQERRDEEIQRLTEEIRPLARRRPDVVSTDDTQQRVNDRLERLYDAALETELWYEDRRQHFLDRKHELEEQRLAAVESLDALDASARTINQVLDMTL
jgi:hypothetical protein